MPRTIYFDNDVPPQVHRMRALGGPIFSALGLLSSVLVRFLAPRDSLLRELADWSCIGHGFIFAGSLTPLPIVDGGSILKWTLVERGRTPDEADAVMQRLDLAIVGGLATAGLTAGASWLYSRRPRDRVPSRESLDAPEAAQLAQQSQISGWRVTHGPLWLTIEGTSG